MTNQPGTMKNHGNQPKTMKNHETTLKNHGNQPKTMKNHETTLITHENQQKKCSFFVTNKQNCIIIYISSSHDDHHKHLFSACSTRRCGLLLVVEPLLFSRLLVSDPREVTMVLIRRRMPGILWCRWLLCSWWRSCRRVQDNRGGSRISSNPKCSPQCFKQYSL